MKYFCLKPHQTGVSAMIISFSVKNYKSICERITLNFEANLKDCTFPQNIVKEIAHEEDNEIGCLTTLGIWGANASGKSNILQAISDFLYLITNSNHYDIDDVIEEYKPFRLSQETKTNPIEFEIEFILKNTRYLYLVEIQQDKVLKEILYKYGKRGKNYLFKRENPTDDNVSVKRNPSLLRGRISIVSCLKNQLFLSCAANSSAGISIIQEIYQYFNARGLFDSTKLKHEIEKYYNNNLYFNRLAAFITSIDIGVTKVEMQEDKISSKKIPLFYHSNSDELFQLSDESEGTQCVFKLIPFYFHILEKGYWYFIDEIESHLHPAVVALLIRLFHDPEVNKKGAQLLFTTHALSLLDNETMRRDQICFTQKNHEGKTELYALDEFKVRKEVDFFRWYQDGRFDALPDLQYDKLKSKIVTALAEE